MTTRAIVPNADGEGSIGVDTLKWGAMYVNTPDTGANDESVPTTAWVQTLLADALKTVKEEIYKQAKLDAHPVGSYYWSNESTSPADLFGGTWEALPAGYTLIAQGSGTDDFGSYSYTAGEKYGERMHKLTTDELASHSHTYWLDTTKKGASQDSGDWFVDAGTIGATNGVGRRSTDAAGQSVPHNTLPPSITSYGWRRTA